MQDTKPGLAIIGVGKLGLCAALGFERKGYNVLGCDINRTLVEAINSRAWQSLEPHVVEYLRESRNFTATHKLEEAAAFSDLLFIFVDTPSGSGPAVYDHSKLSEVLEQLNALRLRGKHIVINSTVMPGYIANVGRYLLKECINTTLSYNPYFVAQGNIFSGFFTPDMVLIGEADRAVGDMLELLYTRVCDSSPTIRRMTPEAAEICKLAVNCFITLKISFANMIGDIADRTEMADKDQILEAVGQDSRIGGKYLKPGYGFGGPCFPRDNRALGYYATSVGVDPILMRASDGYNSLHRDIQVQRLLAEDREVYLFEDVSFKQNSAVPIIEESQKLEVACLLARKHNRKVIIKDRPAVLREVRKVHGRLFEYEEAAGSS